MHNLNGTLFLIFTVAVIGYCLYMATRKPTAIVETPPPSNAIYDQFKNNGYGYKAS